MILKGSDQKIRAFRDWLFPQDLDLHQLRTAHVEAGCIPYLVEWCTTQVQLDGCYVLLYVYGFLIMVMKHFIGNLPCVEDVDIEHGHFLSSGLKLAGGYHNSIWG